MPEPIDPATKFEPATSDLEDKILDLLEDAGCPAPINDQIIALINEWEKSKQLWATLKPCPFCGAKLAINERVTKGYCETEACFAQHRGISVSINDAGDVARWNVRARFFQGDRQR